MGQPKGMCRLEPLGTTLLAQVVQLYAGRGWSVTVATLADLAAPYRALLPESPPVGILALSGGDDTARTVLESWQAGGFGSRGVTHLWLHPVDMPLVQAATVETLSIASGQAPASLVRPVVAGNPGHPVIAPSALLDWALARFSPRTDRSMRDVLSAWCDQGGPQVETPVSDAGCVTDFDAPADLDRRGKDKTP